MTASERIREARGNEERRERAYRAALAYSDDGDISSAIVDLTADLLHLAEQYESAEYVHRVAWHHFVAELNESA